MLDRNIQPISTQHFMMVPIQNVSLHSCKQNRFLLVEQVTRISSTELLDNQIGCKCKLYFFFLTHNYKLLASQVWPVSSWWLTNLMHKILFYNKFIIFLYMFRALLCSSSGGQNCIIQHLVSSHTVGGRPVHSPLSTCAPDGHLQGVTIPDAV